MSLIPRHQQQIPAPQEPSSEALHVRVTREPFLEWFTIHLGKDQTEELEPDECRDWFRVRGANMDALERALDRCWNFYEVDIWIQHPKEPTILNPKIEPKI